MKRLLSLIVVLAFVPGLLAQETTTEPAQPEKPKPKMEKPKPKMEKPKPEPPKPVEDGLHPRVKMETTLGDILLELDAEKAPISVANFLAYAESGFYNDTIFHRVIAGFMIQGGGWTAELKERKEGLRPPIKNEWRNGLKNKRGTIAMARGGLPDSATAQFYINVKDNPPLDVPRGGAAYAVFGKVVDGMEVVDKIRQVETRVDPKAQKRYEGDVARGRRPRPPEKAQPVEPPVIKSVVLVSKFDRGKIQAQIAALKQKEIEATLKAKVKQEKQLIDYIAKLETETGKKTEKTASGLMYVILKEGQGPSPKPTDTVEVHYTGRLLDGTKFDSSVDRGQPATFPLNRVIKGWTEGVGLMKVGEKRHLIIPPDLGYGKAGSPPRIPPDAFLAFDVELISIK